jgi:protein O-GlcNAc transferase
VRLRSTLGRQPSLADGWEGLALCLKIQDRLEEAVACHERAVALRPADALRWCNLGLTLSSAGRGSDALACHERALAADPSCVDARFGRAQALQQAARMSEAVAEYDEALAAAPDRAEVRSYRLLAMHYVDGISRERLFEEHLAFGRALGSPAVPALPNGCDPSRRLRVAILSPDLRAHSCAFFIEPILRHLDLEQFELLLYFDHFREDTVSRRLRSHAAVWRNFVGMPGDGVEGAIRADAPDILIDLAGHACMTSRLPIFARRLAPVQLTYLGYPDTTGVPAMDYRFTDGIADPAPEADRFATERLVRFAPTAWAYQAPADAPEPGLPPCGNGEPVTFGCFNYLGKITDATLGLWGRLLQAVPGSRLLLKGSGFGDPSLHGRFLGRMEKVGVDTGRVGLIERTATVAEHLALYRRIDIALDTFPYNGTTTTCEALWMGVPVVTRQGDRHVSRVGASLLRAAGHPEWIAADDEEYIRIAAGLAGDPARLAGIRSALRGEMERGPLLDHAGQAARFGDALRACWRDWCEGRPGRGRTAAGPFLEGKGAPPVPASRDDRIHPPAEGARGPDPRLPLPALGGGA